MTKGCVFCWGSRSFWMAVNCFEMPVFCCYFSDQYTQQTPYLMFRKLFICQSIISWLSGCCGSVTLGPCEILLLIPWVCRRVHCKLTLFGASTSPLLFTARRFSTLRFSSSMSLRYLLRHAETLISILGLSYKNLN